MDINLRNSSNVRDIDISIVNVVVTATLNKPVDLESLSSLFPKMVIYNPDAYPPPVPAYFKSSNMRGKVSIFPSGKMISVGTRSEEEAKKELSLVVNKLKCLDAIEMKIEPKIQNIVAVIDLGFPVDLEKISFLKSVIYEPETFPGAVLRIQLQESITATFLLFSSGKIVCLGLKKVEYIHSALQQLLCIISPAHATILHSKSHDC